MNDWSTSPVAVRSAIPTLETPPIVAKLPATIIFPFESTFTLRISLLGDTVANVGSIRPVAVRRATYDLPVPAIVVNAHHTIILPSGCTSILAILLFASGANTLSTSHVELTLAILVLEEPHTVENDHPITTCQSGCNASAYTLPAGIDALNVASARPVDVRRASPTLDKLPMVVNDHQTINLPSGCCEIAYTTPFGLGMNDVSMLLTERALPIGRMVIVMDPVMNDPS